MENWKKRLKKFHNGIIKRGECRANQEGFLCCLEDKGVIEFISQELDKAREEGYQDCLDDIWEEAKGLRGWTEHDGSISATDIEAGLQEAYLNIESKLKDNK